MVCVCVLFPFARPRPVARSLSCVLCGLSVLISLFLVVNLRFTLMTCVVVYRDSRFKAQKSSQ